MQSGNAENQILPPGIAGVLLSKIGDKMLFALGADTNDVPRITLINGGPYITPVMVNGRQRVDLHWFHNLNGEPLSTQITEAILHAWPQNRNVRGITQITLESDGTMPVSEVSWVSLGKDFHQRYNRLHQQSGNSLRRLEHQEEIDTLQFSAYENLWDKWCLDAAESQQAVEVKPKMGSNLYRYTG